MGDDLMMQFLVDQEETNFNSVFAQFLGATLSKNGDETEVNRPEFFRAATAVFFFLINVS